MSDSRILTLNSGSSSLKFSIHEIGRGRESPRLYGKLERIGEKEGRFKATTPSGETLVDEAVALPDHAFAIHWLLDRLPSFDIGEITAVGHRIVQGGPHHSGPERVTNELLQELHALCPLDPPHLPAALHAVEAAMDVWPDLPHVACFDTSFHRSMPRVAQQLPLPRRLTENTGLMRYGFHGLSYEYIIAELERIAGANAARGKVIIAHLGSGASMAALHYCECVDTTMGFTPASGLMMSSRPGDLDPGVIAYLLRERLMDIDELDAFLYQECGLKGVSGLSSDIRDLVAARQTNVHAQEALDLFCYQARKALGALVAVLDGVETIVFTGGIGENASLARSAICAGLSHLGLEVVPGANEQNQEVISTASSQVTVRVMKTNEELIIARHTARLISASTPLPTVR
ncbi:MAG: acetate/propionate family kinase [Verrucomicrobiaceae bacterium]|nr:acetate/propionate family kinase [Verrucomicrobiaceae bacterium]